MRSSLKSTSLVVLALALPLSAFADISGTLTLAANSALNLDTGATAASGGDLLWSGTALTPQSNATAYSNPALSGASTFAVLTQATVSSFGALATKSAIPSSQLTVGAIIVVHTNAGNYAAILVTANSGSSLTLQFTTFGVASGPAGPVITKVQNNYGVIPPGFANSGIAQGALFFIAGTGLADPAAPAVLQPSTAANGLPATLNGASVKVTVNGTTVVPVFYYAISVALGMVMPSNTPLGTAQVTVTYNGQTSAPFSIQIVASAMGFDAYYGTGAGLGVATNSATGFLYNYGSAIPLGTQVTLWGSGLGADPTRDSKFGYTNFNQIPALAHIYVGGQDAVIGYQGPSGYPGLNQVNITIPLAAPTGCNVALVGVSAAGIPTNFTTLPIGSGACSDPQFGTSGAQFQTLSTQTNVKSGVVGIFNSTSPGSTSSIALANFQSYTGSSYGSASGSVSMGACTVTQTAANSSSSGTSTGLDAGSVSLTNPTGSVIALAPFPQSPGDSFVTLPVGFLTSAGGTFTFKGAGGVNVGAFTTSVVFPNPLLTWTNQAAAAAVSRSGSLLVTWSGGGSGTIVMISGSSSASNGASGDYLCIAPVSAGQFTVPSYVLQALPAGTGSTSVQNQSNYQTFTAPGLDYGAAYGFVGVSVNSTYN